MKKKWPSKQITILLGLAVGSIAIYTWKNEMALIPAGTKAPDFEMQDQHGVGRSLASFRGHNLVLYFYPRDETYACTAEACSFRDRYESFARKEIVVIGVSQDSPASHLSFANNHKLPFILLTDERGEVSKQYGVPKFLGLFPGRVTYVIDPHGTIMGSFHDDMRGTKHVEEALRMLGSTGP
jgi:thioredoxin-dependent peroxiredoxin